mgnify:CR=1 FL=1
MVLLEIVKGRKGPHDKLVRVYAYGEPLSFSEILAILKNYFESEDSYYPVNEGFQGKCMLMKAILEVYSGLPLEDVLRNYGLERKGKRLNIIDKRKKKEDSKSSIEKDVASIRVVDFM